LEGILVKKIAIAILACSVAMALGAWPASGKSAPAKSVYVDCDSASRERQQERAVLLHHGSSGSGESLLGHEQGDDQRRLGDLRPGDVADSA
jgi:hypothetical protein